MDYQKKFPPAQPVAPSLPAGSSGALADRRDGAGYVYNDTIVLIVNVALATGRPLLVSGPSGCGKSSLAPSIANIMGWSYYEQVISSRTQAADLLWRFDTLARLTDAEAGSSKDLEAYIEPGALWWAFDPESARRRGYPVERELGFPKANPVGKPRENKHAVVLLDEIDKADPDVPNDLLVPLGSYEFTVQETRVPVRLWDRKQPPLLVITTNGERELPPAFLRRCLKLELERPSPERLVRIAKNRFPDHAGSEDFQLYEQMASLVGRLPANAGTGASSEIKSPLPSTAEYLDAIAACLELNVRPKEDDPTWNAIADATLWKPADKQGAADAASTV